VSTFAETAPPAELLLTICSITSVPPVYVGVVGGLTLILGDRVEMQDALLISLDAPFIAASQIPTALWAPFYLVLRDYEICILENVLANFGRKIHECDRVVASSNLR
jgi:hypothetical protein